MTLQWPGAAYVVASCTIVCSLASASLFDTPESQISDFVGWVAMRGGEVHFEIWLIADGCIGKAWFAWHCRRTKPRHLLALNMAAFRAHSSATAPHTEYWYHMYSLI